MPSVSARIHANGESRRFLESITIASVCNNILRKHFLELVTIGLIPTGGYTCNKKKSKKAMMWLLHIEETDGGMIMHVREYKVPELPQFSVDGYCPRTRTIFEFFGCYFHGHTCQPFRDVITTSGDTLAER